ncbi:hypothetical protein Glove_79g91 [Diversispora epigaea]|uniref:Large ribosomal subunit protein uL30 N-terminal eukaryotes domain-containing protein n=1 Tax=Diversispora epigaea TaxID=1348612 RepID=A0A397JHV5_9GLOM|nr:hypothetical protein Glove_79g91 [Diversispora epigaea]
MATKGLTVATEEQFYVPETLLKKRKDQEKIAAEKCKAAERAETYVKKYRATESQELRLRRQAKASGNFYVPSKPNLHLLFESKVSTKFYQNHAKSFSFCVLSKPIMMYLLD